ncbi:MAG: hypothetical protein ABJA82_04590 [Myxococcales bacterium]
MLPDVGRACASLLFLLLADACHLPSFRLEPRRTCLAEVCVTPHESQPTATLIVDVEAPEGARLENAVFRVASLAGAPCQAGIPVSVVAVDGQLFPEGPVPISGRHRVRLNFARGDEHGPDRGLVELDVNVRGNRSCVTAPVVASP